MRTWVFFRAAATAARHRRTLHHLSAASPAVSCRLPAASARTVSQTPYRPIVKPKPTTTRQPVFSLFMSVPSQACLVKWSLFSCSERSKLLETKQKQQKNEQKEGRLVSIFRTGSTIDPPDIPKLPSVPSNPATTARSGASSENPFAMPSHVESQ